MKTYSELVKEKEGELSSLYSRMDSDKNLQWLDKYEMKDLDKKKVPNIINITLPDTAIFSANVISALGRANQQVVIESEDKKIDTTEIEEFVEAGFGAANARLRKMGRPQLSSFFDEQVCIRGRAAARCLFREENGVVIPDITPWDTRFVTYDIGVDGLKWAAYKTKRTKGMIEAEYGVQIAGKTAEVVDVWDATHNEIWIAGKLHKEQTHNYGFTPVVYVVVPLGSMLADEDSLEHQGESIFFLIRDIVPELNRLISMAQTVNLLALKPALLQEREGGESATPSDYDELTAPGAITPTPKGYEVKAVPIKDLQRAFDRTNAIIEGRLQRGSLSSIDLGTLQFQLSAVALIEIGENRDQVFLPRLEAKALLNQALAEMFTSQVMQIGGTVQLGVPGHKTSFQISKLDGEYTTRFNYYTKSPKVDVARASVARSYGGLISDDTKRRDIICMEDPDGEKKKLDYEQAARMSRFVATMRIIDSLIDLGEEDEAEIMAAELKMSLEQVMKGELPPMLEEQVGEEPQAPAGLLPLFSGQPSSAKKAAQLEAMPREETGEG